jgi:hypothetical protein
LIPCVLVVIGSLACSEGTDHSLRVTPKVIVGDIPCAPNAVLVNVCQQCHSSPPVHGAPFPLVTYGDVQADLDGHPVFYWMEKYVAAEEMPLPPVELAAGDRATLLQWLRAGAPSRSETCASEAGAVDADEPDVEVATDAFIPEGDTGVDAEVNDVADPYD